VNRQQSLDLIRRTGVIAITRTPSSSQLLRAADAIREGGIAVMEATMTTPWALSIVEQVVIRYGQDVLFGVGTMLDAESARAAILSGAQFVVSPSFGPAVVEMCRRYSVPVIPGA
jgi:2-dehydro-3-deoxyphosphogluconate aldolase/(4S)-4-hydroxy-2-oxoglutarate aldolase